MLESLSNLQMLFLIFGAAQAVLIAAAWCIRRFLLQVMQPSKNILWLISAQLFIIGGASYLIDSGCQYLNVYSFVFEGEPNYCTLPRFYWSGLTALFITSIALSFLWLAKSPLNSGAGRIRHLNAIFDD